METNNNEEKVISIGSLFKALWKNIILFIAVFVGVLIIGLVYSFAIIKPEYKSTSTFVASVKQESASTSNENIDYVNSFRIIETVASLVTEDIVIDDVAAKYNLSNASVRSMVKVSFSEMNYLVSVTVQCQDRELSKNIANSLVEQLIEETSSTPGLQFLDGTVTQTSYAKEGTYASPNKTMCVLVSFVAGLAVACIAVAIKELASTKFKNRVEIESRLSTKVLGYFPEDKEKEKAERAKKWSKVKERKKIELVKSDFKNYELYNVLLNNVKYLDLENPNKAIMLTSSRPNELKSTIICNLAACIAYNGQKVVIIDLDLRKPTVHKVFNVFSDNGLVELFRGECELMDVIKHSEKGVDVITAGKNIINPMALIGNKALPELISKLKEEYDYVLIDTAPVLVCPDAAAIAPLCDGVLFNVAMREVHKKEAEAALSVLKSSGGKIIGVNVTKGTESKVDGGYYGGYNYNYAKAYAVDNTVSEAAVSDAEND